MTPPRTTSVPISRMGPSLRRAGWRIRRWKFDNDVLLSPKLRAVYFSEQIKDYALRNNAGETIAMDGFNEEPFRASLAAETRDNTAGRMLPRLVMQSYGPPATPPASVDLAAGGGAGNFFASEKAIGGEEPALKPAGRSLKNASQAMNARRLLLSAGVCRMYEPCALRIREACLAIVSLILCGSNGMAGSWGQN